MLHFCMTFIICSRVMKEASHKFKRRDEWLVRNSERGARGSQRRPCRNLEPCCFAQISVGTTCIVSSCGSLCIYISFVILVWIHFFGLCENSLLWCCCLIEGTLLLCMFISTLTLFTPLIYRRLFSLLSCLFCISCTLLYRYSGGVTCWCELEDNLEARLHFYLVFVILSCFMLLWYVTSGTRRYLFVWSCFEPFHELSY